MRVVTDLHSHSRFARAVSKQMTIPTLELWGEKKGVSVVGSGDFTHPAWNAELKNDLEEEGNGLLRRKGSSSKTRFLLSSEISCIFSRGAAVRRIHLLVLAPSFAVVDTLNARLGLIGNLKADGRPILGLDVIELVKIVRDVSPDCLVIPAHVWTPWFGMYGSKSGFDSIADCFGDQLDFIPAVETGLSSDPPMNWRFAELDTKAIVSFSDAHSAPNIGREATVLELGEPSFANIAAAFRVPFPTEQNANRIVQTVEFFPEEGMYHWDGHRNCDVRWSPAETKKAKTICPRCGKPVTVGVMHRIDDLAPRPADYRDERRPSVAHLVPLAEIIGSALGIGKLSKTVAREYDALLKMFGNEMEILLNLPLGEFSRAAHPKTAEGLRRVRDGKLTILPGYDGVYGTVKVFSDEELKATSQSTLL
ncbi:MAG: DNA helicase UvrD [Candidatus Kerfeldbacteria bacterium]|nr:DNA helicase UvrD [Candidatus Kerfeldbacteria bacterium]